MSQTSPNHSSTPVAVITGAGSGIGKAVAERMLRAGLRVAGWDLHGAAVDWLDARDEQTTGLAVRVDVRDPESVRAATDRTLEHFGRVDHLVNSAGLFMVAGLEEAAAQDVRRLFDVNVLGPTLVTQQLVPALREARGSVVNLASAVAIKATVTNAHYSASKAAVAHLTRCWALELGPEGIRVNAVAPGPVPTNIYTAAGMSQQDSEQLLSSRAASLPLRRNGTPEAVAEWVHRLAVDSEWVTGQVLAVDGGMSVG